MDEPVRFISTVQVGITVFSILIGATAQQLVPEKRSFAAGFINAGGSLGQFVFAPLVQYALTVPTLAQLGIQQGDVILIGGQPFTIRGVLLKEPGRQAGALPARLHPRREDPRQR